MIDLSEIVALSCSQGLCFDLWTVSTLTSGLCKLADLVGLHIDRRGGSGMAVGHAARTIEAFEVTRSVELVKERFRRRTTRSIRSFATRTAWQMSSMPTNRLTDTPNVCSCATSTSRLGLKAV